MTRIAALLLVLAAASTARAGAYRLVIVPAQDKAKTTDPEMLKSITDTLRVAAVTGLGPKNWMIAPEESVRTFFKDLDFTAANCGFQCEQALGRYYEADVVVTTAVTKEATGYVAIVRASVPAAARELAAARVEAATPPELRAAIEDKASGIFEQLRDVKPQNRHGPYWWLALRGNVLSPSGLAGAELELKVGRLAFAATYGLRAGGAVSFLPLDQHGGPFFRAGYSTTRHLSSPVTDAQDVVGATAGWDFRAMENRLSICMGLGADWSVFPEGKGDTGFQPLGDVRVGWVFF